jgi:hypothetical protein
LRRLAVVALVAACGGGGGAVEGGDAGAPPDAGGCGALDEDPPWLDDALADQLATLSGAADIAPGVTLSDRASAAHRDAVRGWLVDRLGDDGIAAELDDYGTGANVIARLPGSDPGAGWILIGAHLDTVAGSPGANDDGSGVVTVLAIARLVRDTCRRRGVIIAFFDQEEIGLLGSTGYADAAFQRGEDLVEVHTVDQVGWDADGDRMFEIELPTPGLFAAYQAAAGALGLGVRQTDTSGTDHQAFRTDGFAAAGVTEEFVGGDTTPHYHTSGDTFATVDLAYTADAVRLVARVVNVAAQ